MAFILVAGWLVWEANLIRTGRKPITTYLRYTVMRYPGWALAPSPYRHSTSRRTLN